MPSSAVAAKYAKENKNILCIVNTLAIDKYKLKIQKNNMKHQHSYIKNKYRNKQRHKKQINKHVFQALSLVLYDEFTL